MNLRELVALSDEMEALVRAGIPVERGLLAAAGEGRGRLGLAMRSLAGRLAAGDSLPEALDRSEPTFPRVYRAVVEAGLRSGRLADALQGLTRVGQAVVEARRTIVLACTYPLAVVVLAYALFLVFVVLLMPRFVALSVAFRLDDSPLVRLLSHAGESAAIWGIIPPLIFLALLVAWARSGRALGVDRGGGAGAWVGRFPWVGQIVINYRAANFTDLLAHLVEHRVPLDRAVRLAAEATGSRRLREAGAEVADRIAAGSGLNLVEGRVGGRWAFPPLVAWMLGAGDRQGELAAGLRHLASAYRRKARRQAETFRAVLPGFLVVVIGSVAVLAYGLLLFLPLRQVWEGLGQTSR